MSRILIGESTRAHKIRSSDYREVLLYNFLHGICSARVTLFDKTKKASLLCKNSVRKNTLLAKMLQEYGTDSEYPDMFPTNLEHASQHFKKKCHDKYRIYIEKYGYGLNLDKMNMENIQKVKNNVYNNNNIVRPHTSKLHLPQMSQMAQMPQMPRMPHMTRLPRLPQIQSRNDTNNHNNNKSSMNNTNNSNNTSTLTLRNLNKFTSLNSLNNLNSLNSLNNLSNLNSLNSLSSLSSLSSLGSLGNLSIKDNTKNTNINNTNNNGNNGNNIVRGNKLGQLPLLPRLPLLGIKQEKDTNHNNNNVFEYKVERGGRHIGSSQASRIKMDPIVCANCFN